MLSAALTLILVATTSAAVPQFELNLLTAYPMITPHRQMPRRLSRSVLLATALPERITCGGCLKVLIVLPSYYALHI
jgi:hypothetical protein